MTIQVRCNCGQVYEFADTHAGQQAKCPACQMLFQIPLPTLESFSARLPEPSEVPAQESSLPAESSWPVHSEPSFDGLQEPLSTGYLHSPAATSKSQEASDDETLTPKDWWIIGGSVGGVIVLILIVSLMMPGKNNTRRRVAHRQSTQDVLQTPFWTRAITSGVAVFLGLGLLLVGIEEFQTKKAEEIGRARLTNKLLGRSNHYEGRMAEWMGVSKIVTGIGAMIFAIYFFFNGAG